MSENAKTQIALRFVIQSGNKRYIKKIKIQFVVSFSQIRMLFTDFEDPNFINGRPVLNFRSKQQNTATDNSIESNDSNGHWSTTNSQCGMTASTKTLDV